jgi:hypothetical protein
VSAAAASAIEGGDGRGTHSGFVAPMIFLPVLTTSLPSQTMHTTGPEHM